MLAEAQQRVSLDFSDDTHLCLNIIPIYIAARTHGLISFHVCWHDGTFIQGYHIYQDGRGAPIDELWIP